MFFVCHAEHSEASDYSTMMTDKQLMTALDDKNFRMYKSAHSLCSV